MLLEQATLTIHALGHILDQASRSSAQREAHLTALFLMKENHDVSNHTAYELVLVVSGFPAMRTSAAYRRRAQNGLCMVGA